MFMRLRVVYFYYFSFSLVSFIYLFLCFYLQNLIKYGWVRYSIFNIKYHNDKNFCFSIPSGYIVLPAFIYMKFKLRSK